MIHSSSWAVGTTRTYDWQPNRLPWPHPPAAQLLESPAARRRAHIAKPTEAPTQPQRPPPQKQSPRPPPRPPTLSAGTQQQSPDRLRPPLPALRHPSTPRNIRSHRQLPADTQDAASARRSNRHAAETRAPKASETSGPMPQAVSLRNAPREMGNPHRKRADRTPRHPAQLHRAIRTTRCLYTLTPTMSSVKT